MSSFWTGCTPVLEWLPWHVSRVSWQASKTNSFPPVVFCMSGATTTRNTAGRQAGLSIALTNNPGWPRTRPSPVSRIPGWDETLSRPNSRMADPAAAGKRHIWKPAWRSAVSLAVRPCQAGLSQKLNMFFLPELPDESDPCWTDYRPVPVSSVNFFRSYLMGKGEGANRRQRRLGECKDQQILP